MKVTTIELSLPDKHYGVLLINLGTPDQPDTKGVKKYLKQFLSDPRVIDYPRWAWWLILNLAILPVRSPIVAKKYQSIWTDQGSPLRVITHKQASAIEAKLTQAFGINVAVEVGMTYGSPSIKTGLDKLLAKGVERIVVLPVYPQYSATTTAATFDALNAELAKIRNLPQIRFIKHYAHEPSYIEALVDSIRRHRAKSTVTASLLLFSFHGLPKRYVKLGDPYQAECEQTAKNVAQAMGLADDEWFVSYQSRVGKEEWLQPYTEQTLKDFPAKGIKNIDVVCPAFAVDCLETLEEIAIENKEVFMSAGGESYQYIAALNDDEGHIEALTEVVVGQLVGW
jgi:ferrochelatase